MTVRSIIVCASRASRTNSFGRNWGRIVRPPFSMSPAYRGCQLPEFPPMLCEACERNRGVSQFYDPNTAVCKQCTNILVPGSKPNKGPKGMKLKGRKASRESRERQLKYRYGLSLRDYNGLYLEQNGVCAICECTNTDMWVDHNHWTGKVRGLLCRSCNTALGMFKEDSRLLKKAALYLELGDRQ